MLTCPYCGNETELVAGAIMYPHRKDLYDLKFWRCEPCDAYVGCHKRSTKPLGTLANAELREARKRAHKAFDDIWRMGFKPRSSAYTWLASVLGIPKRSCHIAMMTEAQCANTVAASERFFEDIK